jgi:hypothetical protein
MLRSTILHRAVEHLTKLAEMASATYRNSKPHYTETTPQGDDMSHRSLSASAVQPWPAYRKLAFNDVRKAPTMPDAAFARLCGLPAEDQVGIGSLLKADGTPMRVILVSERPEDDGEMEERVLAGDATPQECRRVLWDILDDHLFLLIRVITCLRRSRW